MNKFLSSIIHVIFMAPVYGILYLGVFHANFLRSDFAVFTFLTASTAIIFLTANKVMSKMDKISKPGITDHFRQSGLLYLLGIVLFLMYPGCDPVNPENYRGGGEPPLCAPTSEMFIGFLNISLIIILTAVAINIFYLVYLHYRPRKVNVT